MSQPLVAVERGAIATLRLQSPPLNLVTAEMTRALDVALRELEHDGDVRVVLVTGSGDRAFCAGSDIGEFEDLQGRVGQGKLLYENAVHRRLARLPVPTIAVIHADALGGGLELALCCDLRVADERARLGLPEVRLGVMPGSGGTQRLPRLIGPGRAKEMILLGEVVDAAAAGEMGLVNRVTPAGAAMAEARNLAETIASRGPVAVREAKAAIDRAAELPLDAALAADLDASERVFATEDMVEGARAFREKRSPRFRDR
ncbi:MAG: enoyl-CoA hydratase/isomerase family protein [Actinomycetota bacterium]